MANLQTKYMGLELKSPLIAASSGLTDNFQNIKRFQDFGVGAIILKSLFEEEIRIEKKAQLSQMSSSAFLYPETLEFYDYLDGSENESTQRYLDLIYKAKRELTIPVIPSINCVTSEQWTHFPKQLQEAGADAIELNVFILPSDFKRTRLENEKTYFDIITEVKKQVSIPISLKVSYYFSDLAIMLKKFSDAGIDALVLFNRFYSPDIDIDAMEVTNGSVLSNQGDFVNSLRWIAILYNHIKCDLAASTGVHDGKTMIKMLLAGATVVQTASAFYKNGMDYASTMLNELNEWMDSKGFKTIEEFRGMMSQPETGNPAAFQRVQFMKYFRGYQK
jgi:dihydroorotate dehydrogenase (fumarate)